jgi:exopolyphosphatase / guanosine-5'-triphosphate,3'-diphosphate pyrophosphatase
MSLFAALDLGTNSFHLVVARPSSAGGFEIVTREKELVRLGHGGGDMKVLSADAIERGIASIARMRRIAESAGAPLRAVATSAVREAENADEFLRRAREIGVEVEVISGVEEARLIHLGVLQAVPVFDRRLMLCDIGGGSTELLIGQQGEVLSARSFKLGAVRLTDRFFPGGRIGKTSAVADCRAYVRSVLAVYEREVEQVGFDVAIGSSGTAGQIARLTHMARGGAPLRTYNCTEFARDELDAAVRSLTAARTPESRRRVAGLEPERADIVVAGALILQGVFAAFGVERMIFSDHALREGVLLDTMQRSQGGTTLHHLRDVSRRSVRHLAELCDDDVEHSAHVAGLALQLFDQTVELHGLDAAARDYLEAAALLANVGLFISHSKHHLHSYYVIRNAEHLAGFTDHEIEVIALIARYHRKSAPKPSHDDFARLGPADQRIVRALAAVLRLAIGLDRSHDRRVVSVTATRRNRRLVVTAIAPDAADLSLELYAANERRGLLEEVLGLRVEVVAG